MNRACLLFILTLAISFTLPLTANAGNFYWGAKAAVSSLELESPKLKIKHIPLFVPQTVKLDSYDKENVFGVNIFYGFDFAWAGNVPLRLETMTSLRTGGSYESNDVYETKGIIPISRVETDLDIDAIISQSLALWLDIPVGSFPIKPYIGVGIGLDAYSYDADMMVNRASGVLERGASKNGWEFAYHYSVGGGAFVKVGKRMFIDLNIQYLTRHNWKIKMPDYDLEFESRLIDGSLGFRYYF